MTRLQWGQPTERLYEIGLDRGVLYLPSVPGVAWSGLISVTESPSGGDPRPLYIDGMKYLNLASAEEFEATIVAFDSPPEFAPCDGVASVQNGLFATQQPRASFGLSYRSRIGNDSEGPDHGYKIHLVYGALAGPSQRVNNTLGDTAAPSSFSWHITTLPPAVTGYKRTAHFVIDSRYTDAELLADVEDILYGDVSSSPTLPDPDDLIALFD